MSLFNRLYFLCPQCKQAIPYDEVEFTFKRCKKCGIKAHTSSLLTTTFRYMVYIDGLYQDDKGINNYQITVAFADRGTKNFVPVYRYHYQQKGFNEKIAYGTAIEFIGKHAPYAEHYNVCPNMCPSIDMPEFVDEVVVKTPLTRWDFIEI